MPKTALFSYFPDCLNHFIFIHSSLRAQMQVLMAETYDLNTSKSELLPGLADKMRSELSDYRRLQTNKAHENSSSTSSALFSAENVIPATASAVLGTVAVLPGRAGFIGKSVAAGFALALGLDSLVHTDNAKRNALLMGSLGAGFLLGKTVRPQLLQGEKVLLRQSRSLHDGFSFNLASSSAAERSGVSFAGGPEKTPSIKLLENRNLTMVTADSSAAPFSNYHDYKTRAWRFPSQETNVYELSGGTRLLYPGRAADYPRISIADSRKLLSEMPDPRLVKELRVIDHAHPDQAWHRYTSGNPNLTIAAESFPNGRIDLFRPVKGPELRNTGIHEWSHLHKMHDARASQLFDDALSFESLRSSSLSKITGHNEVWPVLSESLLSKDPIVASVTASANPVKSMIWARSLEQRLMQLKPFERSIHHADYLNRLDLIKAVSAEPAISKLAAQGSNQAFEMSRFLRF